jgi:uncharacterized protein (DUF2336 family)
MPSRDPARTAASPFAPGFTPDFGPDCGFETSPRPHAAILREVAQVFALRSYHSPGEVAQFEVIASGLAQNADADACAEAARILVDHACAPTPLLETLARRSPGAAAVVFASSRPVSLARLSAAAAWGEAEVAAAVAARGDLDAPLVAALAARPERDVALALARNRAAPIQRHELKALIARARDDAELAEALLPRAEGEDGAPLFLYAGTPLRMQILAAAMRRDLAAGPRPTLRLLDEDGFDAMLAAAARRARDPLASLMGEALEIGAAQAGRVLGDASGEAVALALAALAVDDDPRDLLLMFLAPGDGSSVTRYKRLSRLAGSVPARTARRIVDAIAGRAPRAHAPERRAAESDASLTARAVAGHTARKPEQTSTQAPRRAAPGGGFRRV